MWYCKKQQQEWLIAMRECKIAPCNNQTNFYVALQEQATIAKRQLCCLNDHTLRHVARGYDDGNNG
jgi:hypothetical protein